jgi:hypothetical protein
MRIATVALTVALFSSSAWATDSTADLKQERLTVGQAISEAQTEQQKYSGGLLGSLIAARLEVLKTNDAILQQRILAAEGGAKVSIVISTTAPDIHRAEALSKDMGDLQQRIVAQEEQSNKYTGGLVKGMIESGIATTQFSLEMMRLEYLKAKYGISWVPALNQPSPGSLQSNAAAKDRHEGTPETGSIDRAADLMVPTLSNKRYVPHDYRAGSVEDLLVFDISWDTSKLKHPTRALKGILVFEDLFGEAKYRLRITIDDPLKPGSKFEQKEIGFKYNEFMEQHQWVRSTELRNMKVHFEPQEILYADGSGEKFKGD